MSHREDEILDPSDYLPEPPWGDADFLAVEMDKAVERGEYDAEIEEPDELALLDETTAHNERMRELRAEAGEP